MMGFIVYFAAHEFCGGDLVMCVVLWRHISFSLSYVTDAALPFREDFV